MHKRGTPNKKARKDTAGQTNLSCFLLPSSRPTLPDASLQSLNAAATSSTLPFNKRPLIVVKNQSASLTTCCDDSSGTLHLPLKATEFVGLSLEQRATFLAVWRGQNVFFSGCAGSGKSHLLRLFRNYLPPDSTFFCASTGLAAVNIGGTTLHSWAGAGLGEGTITEVLKKIRRSREALQRWRVCKVLVVDEISMIAGDFFDKLEQIARVIKKNGRAFGGIQVVIAGDMLQLPPVKSTTPIFMSDAWKRVIQLEILLKQGFRQKDDPEWLVLLDDLRVGKLSAENEVKLRASSEHNLDGPIVASKLYPRTMQVDTENRTRLQSIRTPAVQFSCLDKGDSSIHVELLRKHCPAASLVELKKGAQVLLLKNLDTDRGLCNGLRGRVLDFVPIANQGAILNWTASVHDSQGNELKNAFPGYVEIGVDITAPYTLKNNKRAGVGGECLSSPGAPLLLPRVLFENGVVCVIEPHAYDIMEGLHTKATRLQIPLMLAWATSIHRCQGMTLSKAEIDAQGMFENGQLYCSLSRVATFKGVRLLNFTRDALKFDERCVQFYDDMEKRTANHVESVLAATQLVFTEDPEQ